MKKYKLYMVYKESDIQKGISDIIFLIYNKKIIKPNKLEINFDFNYIHSKCIRFELLITENELNLLYDGLENSILEKFKKDFLLGYNIEVLDTNDKLT